MLLNILCCPGQPPPPRKTRPQMTIVCLAGWPFLTFYSCSTELMRRVRRFQVAQYKCLVIKYAKDTRYSNSFSTHDRLWGSAPPFPQYTKPLPTC
uniref:Thymidine kinase, cytosolic n=1 Tax=Spermophilus dauricus TaxID=99837 RepID=A0A8C9PPC9_SPEDA